MFFENHMFHQANLTFFITSSVLLSKFNIFVNNESFIAGSAGPSHKASDEEGTDKAEPSDDKGSFCEFRQKLGLDPIRGKV